MLDRLYADGGAHGGSVVALAKADGAVWVSTQTGLGRLQADGRWEVLTAANGLPEGRYGPIAAGPDGRVWLGIENKLFTSGEQGRWQEEATPSLGGWIRNIVFTQDGSAWLLGSTVAYRYAGEEWEAFTLPSGNRVTDLYDVAVEADGAVWLGTGHGALRYDGLKR